MITLISTQKKRLQDSTSGTGLNNGQFFSVSGLATASFTITGTFVGTVTFEISNDAGLNWFSINVMAINSTTPSTTSTAPGIYVATVKCLDLVRARISAYTSGTVIVDLRASQI